VHRHAGVRNWTTLASLAVIATLVAASCGSDNNKSSSSTPAAASTPTGSGAPAGKARELVIARDMDVNSLDISRSYCDTCQIFNTAVYETLITVDPKDPNTIVARLANKWQANADNTVFTFTIDPAAKFADGSPVESKDVKW